MVIIDVYPPENFADAIKILVSIIIHLLVLSGLFL
jgi:hypothetical protein